MISYLGSLVQFSPAAGRAGAAGRYHCVWGALPVFRPHWVCPAQGCLCFPVCTAQAPGCSIWSGPCVECGSSFRVPHKSAHSVAPACCAFRGLSGSGSQRLGALSPCAARLFPPRPQRAPPVGSQGVFRQDPRPVCRVGGGGFSGAEFAPCPSPPPPTSSGDGAALLWSFSVPLFCEPPAVCSSRSILPSLSHSLKNLPPTALRAFGPVPTLRNAADSSPFHPHLLVAGAGVWGTFLLGVAFRHVICGPYLISPPS